MKSFFDRIRKFAGEVKEEFLKCTRPSKEELKESTIVVVAAMCMLGVFIFVTDLAVSKVLKTVITTNSH